MPLIQKPNYNQIFASQAPEQDKPAVFNNYPLGWGVESRPNNGKPTIKGFNYLQQTSDLKDLWIIQNGACLPYDESIEYAEGAPVLKDGVIQYKTASGFKSRDAVTVPTYNNAVDGVDPVTGVADGAYFNVRSTRDNSYVDEYQNVGGSAVATGKSYPSAQALVEVQQTVAAVGETVTSVDRKLKRENVSVWDFFTEAELNAYNANLTTFDAYRPLQEFLTYISNNDVGTAHADGVFWISSGLMLGGANNSKTKNVIGCLDLYALNAIDTMFLSQAGHDFVWLGSLRVTGTGSVSHASRTCRVGIQIGGTYNAARNQYGMLYARYFNQFGVMFENNTTLTEAENIKVYDCGSGFAASPSYSIISDYTSVNEGSQGSVGQRTAISVDTLPPELPIGIPCFVAVGTDYYYVYDVDRTASTVRVFPWLKSTQSTGNLRYVFGAGVSVRGGDASVVQIGRIDSQRCSISLHDMALYGVSVGILCGQSVGVAYAMGHNPSAANVAGGVEAFYCEGNDIDILRVSRAGLSKHISSVHVSAPHKIRYTCAARIASGELTAFNNMKTVTWEYQGSALTFEEFTTGTASTLSLTSSIRTPSLVNRDSHTFNIETPNLDILNNFGIGSREIKVSGTGAEGRPTGSIVFSAPSGYTVNGQAQVSFSGFTRYADFYAFLAPSSTDIKVYCANLTSGSTATVAYAEQTIPANSSVTNDVMVTGVILGDIVTASLDNSLDGTIMSASVVSENTVAITHINPKSSSVTLATSNLKVKIN